jgi:hypothetical protein
MVRFSVQTLAEPEPDHYWTKPMVQSMVLLTGRTEPMVRFMVLRICLRTGPNWTCPSLVQPHLGAFRVELVVNSTKSNNSHW